tara:strand:+ start:674 stop:1333 length:660 start_codon:yes stop_codon:yes gene_type:complete
MKTLVLITLLAVSVNSLALAETTISYSDIPHKKIRKADENYVRFPGWSDIEIIRKGKINESLLELVDLDTWHQDVDVNEIEDLILKALDIIPNQMTVTDTEITVPFVVDLRFIESSLMGNLTPFQGTLEAKGLLRIAIEKGRLIHVTVTQFDDSRDAEATGREYGAIDQYDEHFASSVVEPHLETFFSKPEPFFTLIEILNLNAAEEEDSANNVESPII